MPTPLSPQLLLQLSWSKLQEIVAINDPWKRAFFENECLKANWSVRQLRRQIGSLLYERALLTHIQSFLLELGEGFCFEARQKRITVGRQHDALPSAEKIRAFLEADREFIESLTPLPVAKKKSLRKPDGLKKNKKP